MRLELSLLFSLSRYILGKRSPGILCFLLGQIRTLLSPFALETQEVRVIILKDILKITLLSEFVKAGHFICKFMERLLQKELHLYSYFQTQYNMCTGAHCSSFLKNWQSVKADLSQKMSAGEYGRIKKEDGSGKERGRMSQVLELLFLA